MRIATIRVFLLAVLTIFELDGSVASPIRLIDAAGRSVELASSTHRIALSDALDVLMLSVLLDDPVEAVVGWAGADRLDNHVVRRLQQDFSSFDSVEQLGLSPSDLSAEAIIAAAPDVLIAGGGTSPSNPVFEQIAAAGIPTIFIFPPSGATGTQTETTEKAITLLGAVLGAADRAEDFVTFHRRKINRIRERLDKVTDRPLVFVEAHAGSKDCCWSPGSQTDYVEFAGGRNLGAGLAGLEAGQISLEFIIAADPQVVIGTGGLHMRGEGGLVLGVDVGQREASESLLNTMSRPGIDTLTAVRTKRFHGVWHQLLGTPWDIVALEAMAQWIHPVLFDDINPRDTLVEINKRYSSTPLSGTFLIEPTP